jgi:hypothetical protein
MPIKVFAVIFFTFGTEMQTSNPLPAALPSAMTSLSLLGYRFLKVTQLVEY